jgi:hypothetical protein
MAMVWNIIGILLCGGLGGFAAWALVTGMGLEGVFGAVAAAIIGMGLAVALWAGLTAFLRSLGWIR